MENRQNCIRQRELMDNFLRNRGYTRHPELKSNWDYLNWCVVGCQEHEFVPPCGNKEDRGVPFGGDCNACPLEESVHQFIGEQTTESGVS